MIIGSPVILCKCGSGGAGPSFNFKLDSSYENLPIQTPNRLNLKSFYSFSASYGGMGRGLEAQHQTIGKKLPGGKIMA